VTVGVLIADRPVTTVDNKFAALILCDRAARIDRFSLRVVDGGGARAILAAHCPFAAVGHYMLIFPGHKILLKSFGLDAASMTQRKQYVKYTRIRVCAISTVRVTLTFVL
jgi:hypothetical protein